MRHNTASSMKTTIDLPEPLIEEAKRIAARDSLTLRELVEAGLRMVLKERRARATFKLRDASVDGKGLQDEVQGKSWERIRELVYEGRGG